MSLRLLAGLAVFAAASPSLAQPANFPSLSGEVTVDVIDDFTYRSRNSAREQNDLFTKSVLALDLRFTPLWSIETVAKLEPVKGPTGENRVFGGHGAWIEELFVNFGTEDAAAYVGKFNPSFGIGWNQLPEVYGKDFAADYEIKEKIGAGGVYVFDGDAYGKHRLSASVFFGDDTGLSNSAINRPTVGANSTLRAGRSRKVDGGISNSESLSSFTVAVDGSDIPSVPDLTYHLALQRQVRSDRDANSQIGGAAALQYRLALSERDAVMPLVEYVGLRGANGQTADRHYLTGSVALLHDDWTLRLTQSARNNEIRGTDATTAVNFVDHAGDTLRAVSLGYAITEEFNVAVGWRRAKLGAVTNDSAGLFLEYSFAF